MRFDDRESKYVRGEEEEEEGADAGAAGGEGATAEAETVGEGHENGVAEEEEEEGANAVSGGDVGVVDAVVVGVLRVRHHPRLQPINHEQRMKIEANGTTCVGKEQCGGEYGAAALLGGDGQGEGDEVEEENEGHA